MAAKYWYVANNGNATWATTANWYNGSGGTAGLSGLPVAGDDVYLDANSGSGILTIAASAAFNSLTCTGFTGTLAGTSAIAFTGNITLGSGMGLTYTGIATLGAGTGLLITNGKTVTFNIVVNNAAALLGFTSDFTSTATASLTLTSGFAGWYGTAYSISIGSFVSTGAVTRILGADLNIIGTGTVWNVSGTNFAFNSTSATITDSSASAKTITHTPTTAPSGYDYRASFDITGTGTGSYTLTGNFNNVNCFNTGGASISFGTSTFFGALDWGLYGPSPNMNWNNGATTITFNSDSSAMYFNSAMTITASAAISVNNPTATTTMVISNLYNKSLTSAITVVGGATYAGGIYVSEGNLITTSTITLTSGNIVYGTYTPGQGGVYCASLSISNTNPRTFSMYDLYLTGSGTLLTATTTTNLGMSIENIYVSGTSSLARTLSLNTVFFPNTGVYLAGSGSGSIALAASTIGYFNVYVTNTGAAPVSFSTATINSLIFSPGTNAVWSNAASVTLTIGGDFKIASSAGSPTLTPNIILNGTYPYTNSSGLNIDVALGGKALVTGTITINQVSDGVNFHFLDSFSMNAALNVTFANSVDFTGAFSGTTLTVSKTVEIAFNSTLTLSGGITLVNDTTFYFPNSLTLRGTTSCTTIAHSALGAITVYAPLTTTTSIVINNVNGTNTFTSLNGATVTTPTFTVTNGAVTLNGSLVVSGVISFSTGQLSINGNYNITASSFISTGSGVRTLGLGTGTWTLTGTGTLWSIAATNLTFGAGNSTINITDSSATAIAFAGGSVAYNNLQFNRGGSTGGITLTGTNSFINFIDIGTAAHSILFTAGTTQTVGNFVVNGTTGAQITLNSTSTTTFGLSKSPAGLVNCDFLNIQHCLATPSTGTWYAGTNSTNNQAVASAGSGWIFTNMPPRKLGAGGAG